MAAANALGCRQLHSEEMADGREIDGTTIINPFR
jgi:predicted nucleic acid-binding protein